MFFGGTATLSLDEYALESSLQPNKKEALGLEHTNTPIILFEDKGQTMYYTASKSQPIYVLTFTSDNL